MLKNQSMIELARNIQYQVATQETQEKQTITLSSPSFSLSLSFSFSPFDSVNNNGDCCIMTVLVHHGLRYNFHVDPFVHM